MDLKAEAGRLAEEAARDVIYVSSNFRAAAIESALLAFGRLVREEDARVCDAGVKWTPPWTRSLEIMSRETAVLLAKTIRANSLE